MTTSGQAIYYDGVTSAQHRVTVELSPAALVIRDADGTILDQWAYDAIEQKSAPDNVLRLGRAGSDKLARLEIRDGHLAAAIDELSIPIDRSGRSERRARAKVVAWSVAATISLLLVAIFGVPAIATGLAPLVPYAVERKLGEVVDAQIRQMLDSKKSGTAFECGTADREKSAQAVLEKLVGTLEQAADLPIPLRVTVVRTSDANAITLPGGTVYVFRGLIDKSQAPDELAGVLAHELGHVAHRDSTRAVLQGAGLSFLFGMLLGDFVGGGAVVLAAKVILQTSYSREVEGAADRFAVELMSKLGADARALGTILERIAGSTHSGPKILLDHPETEARIAAINALAKSGPARPLLDPKEWAELKNICAGA